jgi:MFS family permease
MYLCLFVTGVAGAFSFPARWALLPELVPRDLFHNAVTWRSSGWQVAAVFGPALGGIIIGLWKQATFVYLADAAFGMTVLACLAGLRARNRPTAGDVWSWESLLAGVRFVRESSLIRATITLDKFAVLLGGAVTLLPVYAKDILRVGPSGLGWLRAAPAVGALVMALILAHRPPFRHAGPALLAAVVGFGIATVVFGVSKSFYLSMAMLFLTGLFDNVSVVIRSTLLQALTPDHLQGRVSAVNSVFIGMSNELGSFESGAAAWLMGTVGSVVFGGIGSLAVVLGVAWRWPEVATLGTIRHVSHEAGTPGPVPAGDPPGWGQPTRSTTEPVPIAGDDDVA